MQSVVKEFGKIDILLNNAGINKRIPAMEISEEDWDAVIDVNLKGAFFMSRECAKVMAPHRQRKNHHHSFADFVSRFANSGALLGSQRRHEPIDETHGRRMGRP